VLLSQWFLCAAAQKRERPLPAPARPLEEVGEAEMGAALALLRGETAAVRRAMGHEGVLAEEYAEAAAAVEREFIFIPARQGYERVASATNAERLASIQARDLIRLRQCGILQCPFLHVGCLPCLPCPGSQGDGR
jgi:hypothetical protein